MILYRYSVIRRCFKDEGHTAENPWWYCTRPSHHRDSQNAMLCVRVTRRMQFNPPLSWVRDYCKSHRSGSWQTAPSQTQTFAYSLWICAFLKFISPDLYIRLVSHLRANSHTRSQMATCSYTNLCKIKMCEASQASHRPATDWRDTGRQDGYTLHRKPKSHSLTFRLNMYSWVCLLFNVTFQPCFGLNGRYSYTNPGFTSNPSHEKRFIYFSYEIKMRIHFVLV